jgi:hypothetical protein
MVLGALETQFKGKTNKIKGAKNSATCGHCQFNRRTKTKKTFVSFKKANCDCARRKEMKFD